MCYPFVIVLPFVRNDDASLYINVHTVDECVELASPVSEYCYVEKEKNR